MTNNSEPPVRGKAFIVSARIGGDEAPVQLFQGREAWALLQLVAAGVNGITPISRPAPRWSAYIRQLRLRGVGIRTVKERHGPPFAGQHGRYVLTMPVVVVSPT